MPATSTMSLMPTGMPCSGPRSCPDASSLAAWSAARSRPLAVDQHPGVNLRVKSVYCVDRLLRRATAGWSCRERKALAASAIVIVSVILAVIPQRTRSAVAGGRQRSPNYWRLRGFRRNLRVKRRAGDSWSPRRRTGERLQNRAFEAKIDDRQGRAASGREFSAMKFDIGEVVVTPAASCGARGSRPVRRRRVGSTSGR